MKKFQHAMDYLKSGRWGTCGDCPESVDGMKHPQDCEHTARYDHHLTNVPVWWAKQLAITLIAIVIALAAILAGVILALR